MKILSKHGDEFRILLLPNEKIERGDYILVEDVREKRALILQVYDETYLDSPGMEEEMLRDELFRDEKGQMLDPYNLRSISYLIKDARVLKCKVRASVENGKISSNVSWVPSRVHSKVTRMPYEDLFKIIGKRGRKIRIGTTSTGDEFVINAEDIDGRLTIITGKKEAGKSHLAKLLVAGLLDHGAYVIVFDINDEYSGLSFLKDGGPSRYISKIRVLEPGVNLKFTLKYVGKIVFMDVLQHVLDTPGASFREFLRIWDYLESRGQLNMRSLYECILRWKCNEMVRDALLSRYYTLASSSLFTDIEPKGTKIEELYRESTEGTAFIISLGKTSPITRRIVVEIILSKLLRLLEERLIPPTFLIAEEAHLYLRETYWEDLVTRMRHFGIFTIFVTNQPDALGASIYRQADNIFLYNFTNEKDLDMISQASVTDSETIKSIVKMLPPHYCLVIGKVVSDLPIVVKVSEAPFETLGYTKRFFKPIENKVMDSTNKYCQI